MLKKMIVVILLLGVVGFSKTNTTRNNSKEIKVNQNLQTKKDVKEIDFSKIKLRIIGMRALNNKNEIEIKYEKIEASGKDKKKYTASDLNNPRIIITKEISSEIMRYLIESDDIAVEIAGILEKDANGEGGVKYKPFDLEFSASKYSIKRMYINNKIIYFK